MTQIEITLDLIRSLLFEDTHVTIISIASIDRYRGTITLEIEGVDVPEVDRVFAEITEAKRTIQFIPTEE